MSKQPTAGEWHDTAEDSSDAGAGVQQQQSQTDALNHSFVLIKETMAEAIVAFSSLAKSVIETEAHLQNTAERLEATVQRLDVSQRDVLETLDSHVRRFTTFLVWTLLLATFAAAAAAIAILFSIFTAH